MVNYLKPANSSDYSSGDMIDIACAVHDSNTSSAIENYPVTIYKSGTSFHTDNTDEYGMVNTTWNTGGESAGWYNISCAISSNPTLYYNYTAPTDDTWVMLRRPLLIDIIRIDNSICTQGTSCEWLYRNDSFNPHQLNISVHVNDANIGSAANSNVTFYNSTSLLGNCTTNSTGWCFLTNYNPYDSHIPGLETIYINATRTENENSATNTTIITVKGILTTTGSS